MRRVALLFPLFLCCASLSSDTGDCHTDGPGRCRFQYWTWNAWPPGYYPTSCSWSKGSNVYDHKLSWNDWCVRLSPGQEGGKLTSRVACSTRGQEHCLSFYYKFDQNDTTDLTVNIKHTGFTDVPSNVWSMSSNHDWSIAEVPINTGWEFTVVFVARRHPESTSVGNSVYIDDIVYLKSRCPDGLYPPSAVPKPVSTSSTQVITTPTARTTSASSTTWNDTASTSPTESGTSSGTFTLHFQRTSRDLALTKVLGTTKAMPGNADDPDGDKSNELEIIIGVVVAVLIVIIAVIVVLLLVFRRKHLHILKTCWGKKQPKEQFHMNASDNAAYSLDANDHVVNLHTRQNSDNDRLEAETSSRSQTNHLYENSPPDNPSQPVYAMVNKSRKAKQENTPQSRGKPGTTTYELCKEDAMSCPQATGTEYQNLPQTTTKQDQGGPTNDSTPIQTVSNGHSLAQPQITDPVYHILEKDPEAESRNVYHVPNTASRASSKDPDTEYNRLNFNQRSGAEADNFDGQKSEKAAGGVYNHLNEGIGDAYSEVHREKKAEVIDGVYSHIK